MIISTDTLVINKSSLLSLREQSSAACGVIAAPINLPCIPWKILPVVRLGAAGLWALIRCCRIFWRHMNPMLLLQEKMHCINCMEKVLHFHFRLQQSWQTSLWKIIGKPIFTNPNHSFHMWLYPATLCVSALIFYYQTIKNKHNDRSNKNLYMCVWMQRSSLAHR